ncbi:hypothetical protein GYMLUDRAFT_952616 [Collybiopsis luxurians FD-317 M1]|nr:hypothetical protein GYMLUDRAFT_952616 [Collybiopsis luxurians FD-317 M1]
MQQLHPSVNSSSPFGSSVNMGSISSVGLYTTPPHQSVVHVDGPASTYNDRASTIISRYDSPSPSMQFMNRSQSPDSNVVHTSFAGGVNEMGVQPFLLPPMSTSPPPAPVATKYSNNPSVYDSTVVTRRNSQESIEAPPGSPPPPRRMNPPTYDDAVALSDSQQVASQRRETHGTGHRPPLPEKQPSQTSQTSQGSQDSSVWSAPTVGNANEHGPTAELAAIDAYVNRVHLGGQRPGGSSGGGATEGVDTVPMLHTTAMPPGQHSRPPASAKRSTMNTTIDDGGGSVLGGGHREGGDGDSFGIA